MGKTTRILITGGHATPAVACIEELIKRGYSDIVYVGQKKTLLFDKNVSAEYRIIVDKLKLPFENLITGKISRFMNLHALIWLMRVPIGFFQALFIVLKHRPAVILTFGSHVAVPVCFWGYVLKIPILAHEQTTTVGRSNKFVQRLASKVCISWEQSRDYVESDLKANTDKFVLTGNPIREAILKSNTDHINFAFTSKKTILITGGNQGAHVINEFVFRNIDRLAALYNIIHQTGSNTLFNDFSNAQSIASKLNTHGTVYIVRDYLFAEEMAESYKKADIVVSRSGANTITELLVLKKKSILIPIPNTYENEQYKNAKILEDLGFALIIAQEDLEIDLFISCIDKLLQAKVIDDSSIDKLSKLHLRAAENIVDTLLKLVQ